ncbi:hypothetical protein THF5H11_20101 [Vibrio jasicida]|nr:hypothetical protein THF5H11_20101 [Vibrio jasicida]
MQHQGNVDREVCLIYYLLTNNAGLLCTNSGTCIDNREKVNDVNCWQ